MVPLNAHTSSAIAALVALLLLPTTLAGQWRSEPWPTAVWAVAGSPPGSRTEVPTVPTGTLVIGGVGGAVVGAAVGFALGAYLTDSAAGGVAGALLGESAGLVAGVHLAHDRIDPISSGGLHAFAVSAVAAPLVLLAGTDRALVVGAIAVPLIQLPIVIALKRRYAGRPPT